MLSAETHWGNRDSRLAESYDRFLYNRFRYYDPAIGRYISADPIGQFGIQFDLFLARQAAEERARSLIASVFPRELSLAIRTLDEDLSEARIDTRSGGGLAFASVQLHPYEYALSAPANFVDPLGLAPASDEALNFFKRGAKASKAGGLNASLGVGLCKAGLEVCIKDAGGDRDDALRCQDLYTCATVPPFLPPSQCPNLRGGTSSSQ